MEIGGEGRNRRRNCTETAVALEAAGAKCTTTAGHLPFVISGGIQNEYMEFSGKESSQIVSGFLMMLPLLEKDSVLKISNPASIPYIDLTLQVLESFGIEVCQERNLPQEIIFRIKGGQKYTPTQLYLNSDWSSAANFAVAGALTGGVTLKKMPLESGQADEYILQLLQLLGHRVSITANGELYDITILPGNKPDDASLINVSLQHCPDLFPIATVLAGMRSGTTVLEGVGRLVQKESNREESIFCEFTKLGFEIQIDGDKMYICGKGTACSKESSQELLCSCHNDHRIAMAIYIAAIACEKVIRLNNIKCIDKSFPTFLERLKRQ